MDMAPSLSQHPQPDLVVLPASRTPRRWSRKMAGGSLLGRWVGPHDLPDGQGRPRAQATSAFVPQSPHEPRVPSFCPLPPPVLTAGSSLRCRGHSEPQAPSLAGVTDSQENGESESPGPAWRMQDGKTSLSQCPSGRGPTCPGDTCPQPWGSSLVRCPGHWGVRRPCPSPRHPVCGCGFVVAPGLWGQRQSRLRTPGSPVDAANVPLSEGH